MAHDSRARKLLPPAFGLAIVHDEIALAQVAGGAEIEQPAPDAPVEHDGGVAERAERHCHGQAADGIVHDFVKH